MINAKISSKHDNMHNDDINYALKSLTNNELMCMLSLIVYH